MHIAKLASEYAGLAAALCFIGAGLTLIWFVVRDAKQEEDKEEAEEANASKIKSKGQPLPNNRNERT
jgi:hypothetical protein